MKLKFVRLTLRILIILCVGLIIDLNNVKNDSKKFGARVQSYSPASINNRYSRISIPDLQISTSSRKKLCKPALRPVLTGIPRGRVPDGRKSSPAVRDRNVRVGRPPSPVHRPSPLATSSTGWAPCGTRPTCSAISAGHGIRRPPPPPPHPPARPPPWRRAIDVAAGPRPEAAAPAVVRRPPPTRVDAVAGRTTRPT